MNIRNFRSLGLIAMGMAAVVAAAPAQAQFGNVLRHDPSRCQAGAGPAVQVDITGIRESAGRMRVQLYNGTKEDWLVSGRWLNRIEAPAQAGRMTVCMPVPRTGTYAIAVRHDINGNGKTDITRDGGAMSNNPSINILNLGKPGINKTAFAVGPGVTRITLNMRYM